MIAAALFLAAMLILPAIWWADARAARRRRSEWFGAALPLFETYRVTQDGAQWPVLEGRYRGQPVRLEPVMDDMAWRKLPSLWLKVTLLAPHAGRPTLGYMVRMRGGEFYSPTPDMAHRLPVPPAWPQDAVLASDDALAVAPDLDMRAFDDPRMKELVVTPRGVRLVYQAAQGERAEYLVLRQARFAEAQVRPELVKKLLDDVSGFAAMLDARGVRQAAA